PRVDFDVEGALEVRPWLDLKRADPQRQVVDLPVESLLRQQVAVCGHLFQQDAVWYAGVRPRPVETRLSRRVDHFAGGNACDMAGDVAPEMEPVHGSAARVHVPGRDDGRDDERIDRRLPSVADWRLDGDVVDARQQQA